MAKRDRQGDAIIGGDEQEEGRAVDTPGRSEEGRAEIGGRAQAQGADRETEAQDEAKAGLVRALALLTPRPFKL